MPCPYGYPMSAGLRSWTPTHASLDTHFRGRARISEKPRIANGEWWMVGRNGHAWFVGAQGPAPSAGAQTGLLVRKG
jgi:hypothetical protein